MSSGGSREKAFDAEEGIGVEHEADEELTGSEFRIVDGVPRMYVVFQSQRPYQIREELLSA